MEQFCISITVVDTQIYTWNKTAQSYTHEHTGVSPTGDGCSLLDCSNVIILVLMLSHGYI